jgi:hypothetical protein
MRQGLCQIKCKMETNKQVLLCFFLCWCYVYSGEYDDRCLMLL